MKNFHSTAMGFSAFLFLALAGSGMAQEAEDIRDAKGLVEIPEPPNYLLWFGLALLFLLLGFFLWKWIKRTKQTPAQSAANRAFAQLKKAAGFIDEESAEPLVNAVTSAIRQYVENRFGLAAPRRTTEEFLRDLHRDPDPDILPYKDELGEFLRHCDLVKFGRRQMEEESRKQLLDSARGFVEATKNSTSHKS